MNVRIDLDGRRRKATFERSVHPMHAGDLAEVRKMLDAAYLEARAWLDAAIGKATPLPGAPSTSEAQ